MVSPSNHEPRGTNFHPWVALHQSMKTRIDMSSLKIATLPTSDIKTADVKTTIKDIATGLGFDLVRFTSADEFADDRKVALERIRDGLLAGLPWYTPARVQRGTSPQELLPGARSIICLGLNYHRPQAPSQTPSQSPSEENLQLTGRVASYAQGRNYHRVMKQRMRGLVEELSHRLERELAARWYVDDGPMLDRAAASRSGLGWFGKNTNILSPRLGSWIFLGQIITDLELEPDPPLQKSCGSCVRCIEACPTGAIVGPYVLDNTRCISFQTIENRGAIPRELRPLMMDWIFGCDICQEVCPVNRKAMPTGEPAFQRGNLATLDLLEILSLTEEEFLEKFAGTPIMRTKLVGLKRNACVALGNRREPSAVPALSRSLYGEGALVRGHAAWALGQIGGQAARRALQQAGAAERDEEVSEEINAALAEIESPEPR